MKGGGGGGGGGVGGVGPKRSKLMVCGLTALHE